MKPECIVVSDRRQTRDRQGTDFADEEAIRVGRVKAFGIVHLPGIPPLRLGPGERNGDVQRLLMVQMFNGLLDDWLMAFSTLDIRSRI